MNHRTGRTRTPGPPPQAPLLVRAGVATWTVPTGGENLLLLLCDQAGVVRGLAGPQALLTRAQRSGLISGADLSDEAAGATAVSLAMAEQRPAEVGGDAHTLHALRPWSARAAVVPGHGVAAVFWPATAPPPPAEIELALSLATAALREQAARSEAAWLLQLLETASEPGRGHLLVGSGGRVLLATPAAQRYLGVGRDDDLSLDLPFLWQQLQRNRGAAARFTLRPPAVPGACAVAVRPLPGHPGLTAVSVELLSGARAPEKGFTVRFKFEDIITAAPNMLQALALARSAAATDTPILLLGESGTGKELVAQAIHQASPRADRPFIAVNCAAFPRDLIVSELFGYEEGAYTGARRQGAPGRFEQASGGTLFLDEVGEMAPEQQAMLLRVLEDHTVLRLGGGRPRRVDVRIVAATNQDLKQMVDQGRFRADLYYRLHVIAVRLPPLRERPQDIDLLVRQFSEREGHALGTPLTWTPEALAEMRRYPWPGNVRELYNAGERAAAVAAGGAAAVVDEAALPWVDATQSAATPSRRRLRPEDVAAALAAAAGNVAAAARRLGVARSSIYRLQAREAPDQRSLTGVAGGSDERAAEPKVDRTGARKGRST